MRGGWVLRLRLQGSEGRRERTEERRGPRERTEVDCCEETLRGWYDIAEGVQEKNLGFTEWKEIIAAGAL